MREPRIFTLAEAERTLPLVRRIVQDIMHGYAVWRRAVGRYEVEARDAQARRVKLHVNAGTGAIERSRTRD